MIDPVHFPFKNKPVTNSGLQVWAFMFWVALCFLYPSIGVAIFLVVASYGLFLMVRGIVRDLRKEWRQ